MFFGLHSTRQRKHIVFTKELLHAKCVAIAPLPIGLSTKAQDKKKYLIFSYTEIAFLRWNGLKSDLKQLLKHMFGGEGANLSKIKVTNQ